MATNIRRFVFSSWANVTNFFVKTLNDIKSLCHNNQHLQNMSLFGFKSSLHSQYFGSAETSATDAGYLVLLRSLHLSYTEL